MSWSRFSIMLGKLLRVSAKVTAKVCCASIKARVQFFLYSVVSSSSFWFRVFCAFSLLIVILGGLMRRELGTEFSLKSASYL